MPAALDQRNARERPELVYLWGGLADAWNCYGQRVYTGLSRHLEIPEGCHVVDGKRGREAVLWACQGRLF